MISTHILDTNLGKPAKDVVVKLFSGEGYLLSQSKTNVDGRVSDFALTSLKKGDYYLEFSIGDYFKKLEIETFFPKIVIYFSIIDITQHYHVPLLISPFSYSTYRGS
nr:hydroxyisourate hydrolase [Acinetobacter sp. Marseille-Q1620]